MKPKMNCTETIKKIISSINEHTGASKANLTDAVAELISKSKKGYSLVSSICSGTIEEMTAADFGSVTTITDQLFRNNTRLRYVEIPTSVTKIGVSCFSGCTNLDIDALPEGLRKIEMSTFYNCSNLTLSKLPDMITGIDDTAFYGCSKLKITKIPASVTKIYRAAFYKCTSLESITFLGTPRSIEKSAFSGCTAITEINVPWAEGEVANAPWGATGATVNYNYTN